MRTAEFVETLDQAARVVLTVVSGLPAGLCFFDLAARPGQKI